MPRNPEQKSVDDFASTIDSVEKVNAVKTKYDMSLDLEARAPLGNERANTPPQGKITMYDRFVFLGLRFPLFPLFEEIVDYYKIPLARFTPNLVTYVLGYVKICQGVKVKPCLFLWRYFLRVSIASTNFQYWYIVKRNLTTGAKKIVEAYGGSPIWKPNFMYIKAPEKYFIAWNYRETNGYEAMKEYWTDEDKEKIKEFDKDLKKFEKYSKIVMSLSNGGSRLYGDRDPFPIVNSDEDVLTTVVAGQKKKKKRIVKASDKEKSKRAKTDAPAKETATQGEKIVPPASKEGHIPPLESGPSSVPPSGDKGKGTLEGEIAVLPPHLFEGGPTVAVYTFGDPPTIECPLLDEFSVQLNETNNIRLTSAASMAHLMHLRKLREELVQAQAERDQALLEKVALEEKMQQIQAKETELASVQAKYNEMLATNRMATVIEEVNMLSTRYGAHKVAVAGLTRSSNDTPIRAKWFKQFLMENPKKAMHEALVNVLTKLSVEQLPLWESLCVALTKMGNFEEIAMFPGDIATALARGPSEEEPIPDVQDSHMGIEMEDDEEA
ncbi:OLC1v1031030C1 [Oldenlandia corymbosa var. corymbosa]|uniref:OLC1v1031030C1 n=1 Tax=Oldenlandia corymbosa var. corymbosa TaxID=529605 RepID=A0AAV1CIH7_OLDCO|nr:OLC1v1031030C1 [Oldenlandia corymbosa var. corymbosa]